MSIEELNFLKNTIDSREGQEYSMEHNRWTKAFDIDGYRTPFFISIYYHISYY